MVNINLPISTPRFDQSFELFILRERVPHRCHIQYADSVLNRQWQHRLRRALVEDAVLQHDGVPQVPMTSQRLKRNRVPWILSHHLRETNEHGFPTPFEFLQCLSVTVNRVFVHLLVQAVNLHDVNAVAAQPLQTAVNRCQEFLSWRQHTARCPTAPAPLRGDHHIARLDCVQCITQPGLRIAVSRRRVKQVDTEVNCLGNQSRTLFPCEPGRRAEPTRSARAVRHKRDIYASVAQLAILHLIHGDYGKRCAVRTRQEVDRGNPSLPSCR